MATTWGSIDNHLRVGINITQSPSTVTYLTTQVTLTVKYYVGNDSLGWSFSDTQTLTRTGAITGTTSFTNTLGPGAYDSQLVVTKTLVVSLTGSTQSKTFGASISGAYNGATPSHSRSWTVPAQPAPPVTTPGKPDAPVLISSTDSGGVFAVSSPTADADSVDNWRLQMSSNSSFTAIVYDVTAGVEYDSITTYGGAPSTTYYVRLLAHNSSGWGTTWSNTTTFATIATVTANVFYRKIDDVWTLITTPYIKDPTSTWNDLSEQDIKVFGTWNA